jgi:hypothetical protein
MSKWEILRQNTEFSAKSSPSIKSEETLADFGPKNMCHFEHSPDQLNRISVAIFLFFSVKYILYTKNLQRFSNF